MFDWQSIEDLMVGELTRILPDGPLWQWIINHSLALAFGLALLMVVVIVVLWLVLDVAVDIWKLPIAAAVDGLKFFGWFNPIIAVVAGIAGFAMFATISAAGEKLKWLFASISLVCALAVLPFMGEGLLILTLWLLPINTALMLVSTIID